MPVPTAPSQAVDALPLLGGVRSLLLANTTLTANVSVVRPEIEEPQDTPPYITTDLVSAVRDPDSSYDAPGVIALVQATLVTAGASTALRSQLMPEMLKAVLDHDMSVSGMTVWSVAFDSQRAWSDVVDNVTRRYGAVTYRIHATQP